MMRENDTSNSEGVRALVLDLNSDTAGCKYGNGTDIAGEAAALAQHLQIPLHTVIDGCRKEDRRDRRTADRTAGKAVRHETAETLYLYWDEEGLSLRSGGLSLRGDFTKMLPRLLYHNLTHEMLVRASRFRDSRDSDERHGANNRLTAVDATAGMGEDSLLLAAAGFDVTLYEYDPVIAALLRDTLRRAAQVPDLSDLTAHMHLVEGDSISAMRGFGTNFFPDLILLDPMFPEKRKNSLTREKLQLIRKLEHPCADEEELLNAALGAGARRVVVKRPARGPYLAGNRPAYSITGKTVRYDCYVR